ncbi:DNA adenine methylase [Aetokthonos hydrillicola Thurmond2011]|jgi:DNA adenine methylase|uniref:Site-specific DNA-methyltransferase (adenine-specific) n=1 Tax=Aetokthonos hydrillicola Thurmond2011 TaxID=2712845 RepID=A0AAP5I3I9_9CYAN|nr:DNA adenine methylase [Aetokthonos hydrillicola]MBO3460637.1 DNA adenine methylase [Aetokthonos hydrillicola CCALA 1050]MBW4587781.1 DNA adenine methylase [Aetokthonos hydrillicola CCALA 1050]MDR9894428.1 DNA adenine methylase [Aetokthonos hydrillicola Thurmond2011]
MEAKPFLKWAGGKSQLLEQINTFFPQELMKGTIKKYIEPFVGGGAIFLYLAACYPIEEFFISDINPELVLAYQTIKHNLKDLISVLSDIQKQYLSLNEEERKEYYYQIRLQFNSQRYQINFDKYSQKWAERTAQIIFLNRTCFNGLFRVNSKGYFNVPIGKYKNPTICDSENLKAVSQVLQKTHIRHGDYTLCEDFVDEYSLVYFDPPYRPISKTANFTSYSQKTFDDSEQLRLRDFFTLLDKKGAKLILSNSDPKNEDLSDNFFEIAYENYRIKKVKAKRNINCNSLKRKHIDELLITNY